MHSQKGCVSGFNKNIKRVKEMGLDIYLYKIIDNGDEFHMFEGIASEKAKQFLGDKIIERKEQYIDWENTFIKRGLNLEDYKWAMIDEDGIHFTSLKTDEKIMFPFDYPFETYEATEVGVFVEEIGYQRKGMKEWESVLPDDVDEDGFMTIFEKDKLLKLIPYTEEYCREHFKKEIVDPFIEGEMFVWFWW